MSTACPSGGGLWLAFLLILPAVAGCSSLERRTAAFAELPPAREVVLELDSGLDLQITLDGRGNQPQSRDETSSRRRVLHVREGRDERGRPTADVRIVEHPSLPAGATFRVRVTDEGVIVRDEGGDAVAGDVASLVLADLLMADEWFVPRRELSGRTLQPGDRIELAEARGEVASAMPGSITRPRWSARTLTYRGLRHDGDDKEDSTAMWAVFDVEMTGRLDAAATDDDGVLPGLQVRGSVRLRGQLEARLDDPARLRGSLDGPLLLTGTGVVMGESFRCEIDGRMWHQCRIADRPPDEDGNR